MSEPVKVLPMAKLLRLAREKEERDRAEKESSAAGRSADELEVKAISNKPDDNEQQSSQTIVQETIPQLAIDSQTIDSQTIVQENTAMKVVESAASKLNAQQKQGKSKQPSDTIAPPQTIVHQTIVDNDRGYYPVFNDISDRLIPELQLDPYQQAVLQRLYRLSRGWKSEECEVGLGTLAKYCVMSRSQVQRSVAKLIEKGLLESLGSSKKGSKEGNRYRVLPRLKTISRQTIPNQTIVTETVPSDTIVTEANTSTHENTVVSQGIVPRGTNKNSNKDLKNNTHTEQGVGVGSKFSLEECKRFAEHLQKTGQGINNPGGYATAIFRSGEADAQIEAFLSAPAAAAPFKASDCPDCGGSGYFYPEGVDKGVKICKHEKLKGTG
jgi:DNA-binding MarR family transcriptional regulator